MTFDEARFHAIMDHLVAHAEADNAVLDALLDEINPDWRVEKEAEAQRKTQERIARRAAKKPPVVAVAEEEKPVSTLIDSDVVEVLRSAWCADHRLYLPPTQLERGLYVRTNEVLERLGGQWKGGKIKAHIFEDDPAPLLAEVLATGIMPPKNPLSFYRTPPQVAARVMALAREMLPEPALILEPSAGDGALVSAANAAFPGSYVLAIEKDEKLATKLRSAIDTCEVVHGDFLEFAGTAPDMIVMNPPFAVEGDVLAYVTHVDHAYNLLQTNGVLVTIAPAGLRFRSDKRTVALRERFEQHGWIRDVERDAFVASGTSIATVIAGLKKPVEPGMYYTPERIFGPAAGTGAFLQDAIVSNPPYQMTLEL